MEELLNVRAGPSSPASGHPSTSNAPGALFQAELLGRGDCPMRTTVVNGAGAGAHQTAGATDGRDGSQRCGTCGALGLRMVALICPSWGCGDTILDDTAASEADLRVEAAREHTCPHCGTSGEPIEMLECPGCSNPARAESGAEAQPHQGEAVEQTAGEAGAGVGQSDVTIDPEFSRLIPPLSREELALLESHLLTEGCRDPILVWDDGQHRILLDGHNRFEICRRHELYYDVRTIELQGREAALLWILEHQLGRRNLTPEAQAYLVGKLYSSRKSQGARTGLAAGHYDQRLTAAEQLAAEHHVGEKTIRRHARFAEQLDQLAEAVGPDIKHAVLARDAKITRTDVDRLLKLEAPTRDRIVERVRQGEAAARLIKEALMTVGANKHCPQATSAPVSQEDANRTPTQIEAPTGPHGGAGEPPPDVAPFPADLSGADDGDLLEQPPVVVAFRALDAAVQALNRAAPGEIRGKLLSSIREQIKQAQMALQVHEEVAMRRRP